MYLTKKISILYIVTRDKGAIMPATNTCHNNTNPFVSPRRNKISMLCSIAEPNPKLFPVHGLFENNMQGYRAECSPSQTTTRDQLTSTTIYIANAVQQFLDHKKQDHLFITIALSTLLNQSFYDQLITMMLHTPELYGRLALLLHEDDLYPGTANARAIKSADESLSRAGIQLGIEMKHPTYLNNNHLKCLSAPCILINYSDDGVQPQSNIDALSAIIRYCRSHGCPLLVDYRNKDNRKPS